MIDPTLVYSTYLGSSGYDQGSGIAVDTSGNAYVTGLTTSMNFPVTNGSTYGGFTDAFVTKLDGSGTRVYSIYLGGSGDDQGTGIAADTGGNAYVTGYTVSTNFPVTNGSSYGGATDAFVTKIPASRSFPSPLPPPRPGPAPSGQPAPALQPRPTVPVIGVPNPIPPRRP